MMNSSDQIRRKNSARTRYLYITRDWNTYGKERRFPLKNLSSIGSLLKNLELRLVIFPPQVFPF